MHEWLLTDLGNLIIPIDKLNFSQNQSLSLFLEIWGFEPQSFRMQRGRSTTELYPL